MELKIARVVPLFKAGDKSIFSNYRHISVLLSFSKILEKLVYNRLTLITLVNTRYFRIINLVFVNIIQLNML